MSRVTSMKYLSRQLFWQPVSDCFRSPRKPRATKLSSASTHPVTMTASHRRNLTACAPELFTVLTRTRWMLPGLPRGKAVNWWHPTATPVTARATSPCSRRFPPPPGIAEVNKMVKTFGQPIPTDAVAKIIAYLQSHYTPETRKE